MVRHPVLVELAQAASDLVECPKSPGDVGLIVADVSANVTVELQDEVVDGGKALNPFDPYLARVERANDSTQATLFAAAK